MSRLTAAVVHPEEQRLPHDRQELSDGVAHSQSLRSAELRQVLTFDVLRSGTHRA